MNGKRTLDIFKITEKEVKEVLDLLFLNHATISYNQYVAIGTKQKKEYKYAIKRLGKVQVELVMMYLAFNLSIEHRRRAIDEIGLSKGTINLRFVWRLEQIFLGLTRTAEHVPPEVLAKAHVIHEYWAYLELDQPDTHNQPGTG